MKKDLDYDDYTVGWATVLTSEVNAARLLLDQDHNPLPPKDNDDNIYYLGKMGVHNVVIVSTGAGVYGTSAAGQMVANMLRTFPNIRFGLLVGIGGGAPKPADPMNAARDIRLGDVIVGQPKGIHSGVFQYDMGKWQADGEFSVESHLNKPPRMLLQAVQKLRSDHDLGRGEMNNYMSMMSKTAPMWGGSRFPGRKHDQLFSSSYRHAGGPDCSKCDPKMTEMRTQRASQDPEIHYGLIASANAVMKSAKRRDELRDKYSVDCFEMEAAGLMDSFPCLVIRGVSDYSDDHKNDEWQAYAAVAAAADNILVNGVTVPWNTTYGALGGW
ncbi:hypothetical protein ABW19_dt0205055 [Dactylella cylindrospora]|nr:hypothetical protein ABW19_dt0205055 [Dactylella cylindrospora]